MVLAENARKKVLRDFERLLPELAIDHEVWRAAYDLAKRARAAGVFVPAADLLIAACAKHHGAELEHSDSDFTLLGSVSGHRPDTPNCTPVKQPGYWDGLPRRDLRRTIAAADAAAKLPDPSA